MYGLFFTGRKTNNIEPISAKPVQSSSLVVFMLPTIGDGNYGNWSVRPFFCPSVRLFFLIQVKILVKVALVKLKSNQLKTKCTCSLWYDFSNLNARLEFWPIFLGPLNKENDSVHGACTMDTFLFFGCLQRLPLTLKVFKHPIACSTYIFFTCMYDTRTVIASLF